MADFTKGDHVRWNSEAGTVSGVIIKKHTRDVDYKGHTRHCTPQDPQYEIRSDCCPSLILPMMASLVLPMIGT